MSLTPERKKQIIEILRTCWVALCIFVAFVVKYGGIVLMFILNVLKVVLPVIFFALISFIDGLMGGFIDKAADNANPNNYSNYYRRRNQQP